MKPQKLCKLDKGKLIDIQDGFVDTFNWLVDFCNNIKGEGDIDNSKKLIVDVSVPDAPVIRGGGGSGGGTAEADGKSIDSNAESYTKLELLDFQTKATETDTLAKSMVQSTSADLEFVERGDDPDVSGGKIVKYRKQGYFYAGSNTNITFTPDADGNVAVRVFYV